MGKKFEMDENTTKIALTAIVGIVCGVSMVATGGMTGLGWFIFACWMIW